MFANSKRPPPPTVTTGPETIRYKHTGVGLASAVIANNMYKSEREKQPAPGPDLPKPFEAELVPGITASVPLVLVVNSGGTLPMPLPRFERRPIHAQPRRPGERGWPPW